MHEADRTWALVNAAFAVFTCNCMTGRFCCFHEFDPEEVTWKANVIATGTVKYFYKYINMERLKTTER